MFIINLWHAWSQFKRSIFIMFRTRAYTCNSYVMWFKFYKNSVLRNYEKVPGFTFTSVQKIFSGYTKVPLPVKIRSSSYKRFMKFLWKLFPNINIYILQKNLISNKAGIRISRFYFKFKVLYKIKFRNTLYHYLIPKTECPENGDQDLIPNLTQCRIHSFPLLHTTVDK